MAITTKVSVRIAAEGGRATKREINSVGEAYADLEQRAGKTDGTLNTLTGTFGKHRGGLNLTKRDVAGLGKSYNDLEIEVEQAGHSFTEFNSILEVARKGMGLMKSAIGLVGDAYNGLVFKPLGLAADFETEFAFIKTLGEKLAPDFDQQLKKVAAEVGISATEVARAANEAISSGLKPEIVPEFLRATSKAAIGGRTDLLEATRVLVTATNAYKSEGLEAGRAADVLFATVQRGIVTFEELAASQGSSLGPAAAYGVAFEDINAAVATMTQVMPSAAEAFTRVDALIKGITKPTDEAEKAFKKFGIGFGVTNLQAKGLAGVLEEIRQKTGGNAAALSLLAGRNKEVLEGLMLLNNNYGGFRDNLDYINKAAGQTDQAFGHVDKTMARTLDRLQKEFDEVLRGIGEQLLPMAVDALKQLKDFMSGPGGKALIDGLSTIARALMSIAQGAITAGASMVTKFFGPLMKPMQEYRQRVDEILASTKKAETATLDFGTALTVAYSPANLTNAIKLGAIQAELMQRQAAVVSAAKILSTSETYEEIADGLKMQALAAAAFEKAIGKADVALKAMSTVVPPVLAKVPEGPLKDPSLDKPKAATKADRGDSPILTRLQAAEEAYTQIVANEQAARAALREDEAQRAIAQTRERFDAQIKLAREWGASSVLLEKLRDKEIAKITKEAADRAFERQQALDLRKADFITDETDRELEKLRIRYEEEQRLYADNQEILHELRREYIDKTDALEQARDDATLARAAKEFARQAQDTSTMLGNVDNALGALKELVGVSQVFEKLQMLARGAKYAADAAGYTADAIAAGAAGNPIAAVGFAAAAIAATAAAAKYGASAAGLIGGGRGGGGARAGNAQAPRMTQRDLGPRPGRDTRPTEINVNLFAGDGRPLTRFEAREVALGLDEVRRIAEGRAA